MAKTLGHPNSVVLSYMLSSGLLGNKEHVSKAPSFDCSICKLGKSKALSFPCHGSRVAIFIDDFSRYTWVYFLRSNSKVLSGFRTFVTYIEN